MARQKEEELNRERREHKSKRYRALSPVCPASFCTHACIM